MPFNRHPSRKRICCSEDKTDATDEDLRSSSFSQQHQVISDTISPCRVETGTVITPISHHPSSVEPGDTTYAVDEDLRSFSSSQPHEVIFGTTPPRRAEAGAVITPISDHPSSVIPFTEPCSSFLIQFIQMVTTSSTYGSPEQTLNMFASFLNVSTFPFLLNLYHPYASTTQFLDVLVSATISQTLLFYLDLSSSQNPLMHKLFIFRLFFHVEIDLFIHVCRKWGYSLLFMMIFLSLHMSPNEVVQVLSGHFHIVEITSTLTHSVQKPWINIVA
ncbi:hypothetical protein RCL1_000404 [Eukaryota sp. TZLM3-RCL]